jgi:hypothetical protein
MNLGAQALICRVDSYGPHIYAVWDPGEVFPATKAGFHSIGIGARHFDDVVAAAGYDMSWPLMPALLLAFEAKRQARRAPYVGESTDIVIVYNDGYRNVTDPEIRIIGMHYDGLVERIKDASDETTRGLGEALDSLT